MGSTIKIKNSLEIYSRRKGEHDISKRKAFKDQAPRLSPLFVIHAGPEGLWDETFVVTAPAASVFLSIETCTAAQRFPEAPIWQR